MKATIRFGSNLRFVTPRLATPDANTLATREQIAQKPRPNLDMMGKGRGGIAASHPIKTAAANALTVTRTIIALCVGDNLRSRNSAISLRYFSVGDALSTLRRRSLNFCSASFIFHPLCLESSSTPSWRGRAGILRFQRARRLFRRFRRPTDPLANEGSTPLENPDRAGPELDARAQHPLGLGWPRLRRLFPGRMPRPE